MGKQPVRMKAVIYALSPFQQKTMSGLWRDLPSKIHHKVFDNWHGVSLLFAPLIGVYSVRPHLPRKGEDGSQVLAKLLHIWVAAILIHFCMELAVFLG
ncbi:Cytochrome b-c1 complex subunit 8-2, mitochondrial [Linum perenne]